MVGDEVGPEGQRSTGASAEDELRELMGYYHSLTDTPGEVLLPRLDRDRPGSDQLAAELDATWQLPSYDMEEAEIRQGPPR